MCTRVLVCAKDARFCFCGTPTLILENEFDYLTSPIFSYQILLKYDNLNNYGFTVIV